MYDFNQALREGIGYLCCNFTSGMGDRGFMYTDVERQYVPSMSFIAPGSPIRPIDASEQPRRKWQVKVDGIPLPSPALIEVSSQFGVLRYGWIEDGYDGWSFREIGGGGAVTVPYAIRDGELLIGVIEQYRSNQGGDVLNVPRGFLDPGEEHADAATRELAEETVVEAVVAHELHGRPLNPNSAFFETPEANMGVHVYAVEVPAEILVKEDHAFGLPKEWVDRAWARSHQRARERIGALRFVAWTEAAALGDMFTVAAAARLLSELRRSGGCFIEFRAP